MTSELLPTGNNERETSLLGRHVADQLVKAGEDFLDKEVFEGRLREYAVTASEYGREYREMIRDFIDANEDWKLELKEDEGRVYKAKISTVLFDEEGNSYLISVNDRKAGEAAEFNDPHLDVTAKIELIKNRVQHATVFYQAKEVIDRYLHRAAEGTTREDIVREHYYEKPEVIRERGTRNWEAAGNDDLARGLVKLANIPFQREDSESNESSEFARYEFDNITRQIQSRRAYIIAEEWTAGDEYRELYGQLHEKGLLSQDERYAVANRLLDIQRMNGLPAEMVHRDFAIAVYDLHFDLEAEAAKDDTWDAYSVQAIREILVSPVTYISIEQELSVQVQLGTALATLQLAPHPTRQPL